MKKKGVKQRPGALGTERQRIKNSQIVSYSTTFPSVIVAGALFSLFPASREPAAVSGKMMRLLDGILFSLTRLLLIEESALRDTTRVLIAQQNVFFVHHFSSHPFRPISHCLWGFSEIFQVTMVFLALLHAPTPGACFA